MQYRLMIDTANHHSESDVPEEAAWVATLLLLSRRGAHRLRDGSSCMLKSKH